VVVERFGLSQLKTGIPIISHRCNVAVFAFALVSLNMMTGNSTMRGTSLICRRLVSKFSIENRSKYFTIRSLMLKKDGYD
jgi:hypothetical protein